MLQAGDVLGDRYTIVEEINHGGMARVYLALDPMLALDPDHPRRVAIKVINEDLAEEHEFQMRFRQEAAVMAALPHDNIITIYDFYQKDKLAYIVYPYIDGGTLQSKLGKPLSPAEVVQLLAPVASALDFAHAQQPPIIHRDIKPSNILLTSAGKPLVADFGLARLAGISSSITTTNASVGRGTPPYMSPEQVTPDYPVSGASDQSALGIVAYQLLTGTLPFVGDTPMSTAWMQVSHPLPPPKERNPAIPDGVAAALTRALDKRPDRRFPTCAAFIDGIAQGAGLPSPRDTTTPPTPLPSNDLDKTVVAPITDEVERQRRDQERQNQQRRDQERQERDRHSQSVPKLQSGRTRTAVFGVAIAVIFTAGVLAAVFGARCFASDGNNTNNNNRTADNGNSNSNNGGVAPPIHTFTPTPTPTPTPSPTPTPTPRPTPTPTPAALQVVVPSTKGLNGPLGLAFAADGTLWVADSGNHIIRSVNTTNGSLGDGIGNGKNAVVDGVSGTAAMQNPRMIAGLANGAIDFTDTATVRRILTNNSVETLAGNPNDSNFQDGPVSRALFFMPAGIAVDGRGDVYVAEAENQSGQGNDDVRAIFTDGTVKQIAKVSNPWGVALDPRNGTLYVAESGKNDIVAIDSNGNVRVYAGTGQQGHSNGPRLQATFDAPAALAVASDGTLFVSDGNGLFIRRIGTDGAVTTLPATAPPGSTQTPDIEGMALDGQGNLYLSDFANDSIYRIAAH